jgi:hypothetical protein
MSVALFCYRMVTKGSSPLSAALESERGCQEQARPHRAGRQAWKLREARKNRIRKESTEELDVSFCIESSFVTAPTQREMCLPMPRM